MTEAYEKAWIEFQHIYRTAARMTAAACEQAYLCDTEDSVQFRKDIMMEFGVNKGTVSKMITAGEIINTSTFELPPTYSNIYELAPVKEDLDNFSMYVAQHEEKCLPKMNQKELREAVNTFLHKDEIVEKVDKKVHKSDQFLTDIADKLYSILIKMEDGKVTKQLLSELRVIYERISERSEET